MDPGLSDHVVDEGDFVHNSAERGHCLTEEFPALSVGMEIPDWAQPWAQTVLKGFNGFAEVAGLTMAFDQFGFVVKEVQVTGCTGHEELDHPFGLGRMMSADGSRGGWRALSVKSFALKERGQGDAAEAATGVPEEITPGQWGSGLGLVEGRRVFHGKKAGGGASRQKRTRSG
jgi:hypothetical protein